MQWVAHVQKWDEAVSAANGRLDESKMLAIDAAVSDMKRHARNPKEKDADLSDLKSTVCTTRDQLPQDSSIRGYVTTVINRFCSNGKSGSCPRTVRA